MWPFSTEDGTKVLNWQQALSQKSSRFPSPSHEEVSFFKQTNFIPVDKLRDLGFQQKLGKKKKDSMGPSPESVLLV